MKGQYAMPEAKLQQVLSLVLGSGMAGIRLIDVCAATGLTVHHAQAYMRVLAGRGLFEMTKGPNNRYGPVGIYAVFSEQRKERKRKRARERKRIKTATSPKLPKPAKAQTVEPRNYSWRRPVQIASIWHYANNPINFPLGTRA